MLFGSGFLVWAASILRYIYPDTALPSDTSSHFQLPISSGITSPQTHHNLPNAGSSHPNLNPNPNFEPPFDHPIDIDTTSPPPCTFHTPLQTHTGLVSNHLLLAEQTWIFVSALLSHRIQALYKAGESVMETISVKDELLMFEDLEGFDGVEMGVDGLFVGLVYEGRGGGNGGEEKKDGDVKSCVENAIRGVYAAWQASGWMSLGSVGDAENEDGEWVSYLIYRSKEKIEDSASL